MDLSVGEAGTIITAALIVLVFLAVAVQGWRGTTELSKQANAQVDVRRVAQAVEVADQKEQANYRVNFRTSYDSIELRTHAVALTLGEVEKVHSIHPWQGIETGSVSGDHVCIVKEGGKTGITGCGD